VVARGYRYQEDLRTLRPYIREFRPVLVAVDGGAEALLDAGYRVDLDERDETVGKRIRDAELEKIPRVIVYGDRESERALAVRSRGGEQATVGLEELLQELATL